MCYGKDYAFIGQYSFSSNLYKGICCKPGSNDELCNGEKLECSMASVGAGEGEKYKDVLGMDGKNR